MALQRKVSPRSSSSGAKTFGVVITSCVAVCLVIFAAAGLLSCGGNGVGRAAIDKYVEITYEPSPMLDDSSTDIYIDMSDGMNYAYSNSSDSRMLKTVINKFGGDKNVRFYELAEGEITQKRLDITGLYNYMMNPANYERQRAPIEKALKTIVANKRPAVLMTDFEEYKGNGNSIEHAAYARASFVEWLKMGFNITFYQWSFMENDRPKKMFIAVFDDNNGSLASKIQDAVNQENPHLAKFVLGSAKFAYPVYSRYISDRQGGNYHDGSNVDNVSAVLENGDAESFISYARPVASADGKGGYLPLNYLSGSLSEYYPMGVDYQSALANAKALQEVGVPDEDLYSHFLSLLYVDFGAQDGYTIDAIEARVFDMEPVISAIADSLSVEANIGHKEIDRIKTPEVTMFLTASMEREPQMGNDVYQIFVDFDQKFDGTFVPTVRPEDTMRANIVISKATPNISRAMEFFSWEGNLSLADAVRETLNADSSKPTGRILYSYFIKTI